MREHPGGENASCKGPGVGLGLADLRSRRKAVWQRVGGEGEQVVHKQC